MRSLNELLDTQGSAWPGVRESLERSAGRHRVVRADPARGERALLQLQVTTRSALGAVAFEADHLSLDHGWLRILGAGSEDTQGVVEWNPDMGKQGFLIVAHDVLGGIFAINGGALPGPSGNVAYFAPDALAWESGDFGYGAFVLWAMTERAQEFYAAHRWDGWEAECSPLSADRGFSIYPPLWAKGPSIGERSRRVVPVAELWGLATDMAQQLRGQEPT